MTRIEIRGTHEPATIAQLERCMGVGSAARGVLCADGHLGYAQPVGGVIAYESHVSISGVGFDIGCGNLAVRTDAAFADVAGGLPRILRDVPRHVGFGLGRVNGEAVDHAIFDSPLWKAAGVDNLKRMARDQLGTVGSGNHYVDLFRDEEERVWIGVHFGSRGLGHRCATTFLKKAGGREGIDVEPALVEQDSELGRRYLAAMELAGAYAAAGREWVVERVLRILGARAEESVHNHHNYAWRERHGDRDYWVVRKGATPAFPGQRGFVGGSMGDDAVILEGVDGPASQALLRSTVHGAGRIASRREAKRRFTRQAMEDWLRGREIALVGGDLDESPMAYRRLDEVLEHHADTVRVLHRLRPFAVFMAGAGEFDPYRD
ncbi:MAG TPA: RtcB family protein [Salinarimonas sp.]|nr:RtcB family protein [Salinarimonas sp.]